MKNPPQKNESSLDDPVGISDSPGYLYMHCGAFPPTMLSNPHTVSLIVKELTALVGISCL
ncbi:hypothetical protein KDRO_D01970 [Kluyveromyces lactis]|nr:hypothetical protein KDRO_D01970 [Kluyveromyces lactis]